MLKRVQENNTGMVFLTAIAMIIVAMVITATVMSLNVNQSFLAEKETKRVQAEILAQASYILMHANQLESGVGTIQNMTFNEVLGGGTFSVTATRTNTPSTYDPININVDY